MELIPFGQVLDDRVEISKKYYLIEQTGYIWRLTQKCKDNYDQLSYLKYLKGTVEKPIRISDPTPKEISKPKIKTTPKPKKDYQIKSYHEDLETARLIDSIFEM